MSGKTPKQKGDRLERLLVATLRSHHVTAKRVPLSGSVPDYPGDVNVSLRGAEYVVECKARKDFKTLYGWLEGRDALVLKGDREDMLLVLRLEDVLERITPGGDSNA